MLVSCWRHVRACPGVLEHAGGMSGHAGGMLAGMPGHAARGGGGTYCRACPGMLGACPDMHGRHVRGTRGGTHYPVSWVIA